MALLFLTTAIDGQHGRYTVSLQSDTGPSRDALIEVSTIIHQLTHGLSTRLVGGSADPSCLGWGESAALGEGWSDFFAVMIRNAIDPRSSTGHSSSVWATNEAEGSQKYPYSVVSDIPTTALWPLFSPSYKTSRIWLSIL